nr:hypothetical protein [Candidatus Sigynarchaeota archaeon]
MDFRSFPRAVITTTDNSRCYHEFSREYEVPLQYSATPQRAAITKGQVELSDP